MGERGSNPTSLSWEEAGCVTAMAASWPLNLARGDGRLRRLKSDKGPLNNHQDENHHSRIVACLSHQALLEPGE